MKRHLFGNLGFVGELFKQQLVTNNVIKSIFSSLLGIEFDGSLVTDNTIEAAILLMNKIGYNWEERSKEKAAKKSEEMKETIEKIFARFRELMA